MALQLMNVTTQLKINTNDFPISHPTITMLNQIDFCKECSSKNYQPDEHNMGKDINDSDKETLNHCRNGNSKITNIALYKTSRTH